MKSSREVEDKEEETTYGVEFLEGFADDAKGLSEIFFGDDEGRCESDTGSNGRSVRVNRTRITKKNRLTY